MHIAANIQYFDLLVLFCSLDVLCYILVHRKPTQSPKFKQKHTHTQKNVVNKNCNKL